MIKVQNTLFKTTEKFWNHCLFHPTDAIEDPWGKKIIDRFAKDKSIGTIRIYAMLEDIVYLDEDGELAYDFRINDLRLDYLVENGFDLLIAYASMPECIAENRKAVTSVSKNKTRYKGKMFNTSRPKDYALWEEVCYEYTKHLVERYGIETVKKWRVQCFNEPDAPCFFLLDYKQPEHREFRAREYAKLYDYFQRGVRRVSEEVLVGGPALALPSATDFLEILLNTVKEQNLKMDFISLHTYGTNPFLINDNNDEFCTQAIMDIHQTYLKTINKCGFGHLPIVIDEWGMSSHGYYNVEECPKFMERETEIFSSYFTKLIYDFLHCESIIDKLIICLSGQHEMVTDFSGFRNFFTLNFIAKPIYNAYILSSKLHKNILTYETDDENVFVIPSVNDNELSVMLTYCSEFFKENIPAKKESILLPDGYLGKTVTVWCIDKDTTNPYRLYQKEGYTQDLTAEQIKTLQNEGKLKPITEFTLNKPQIELDLTANCTYLITVK